MDTRILVGIALFWFIAGLVLGGEWQLYWYKKNLVLTAYSHQNEKINGKWYNIYPSKREE
jgi:hypothetical protein